jgi:hypothetical protein
MTDEEKRAAELRSITKLTKNTLKEVEKKSETKKPAKGAKK